MENLAEEPGRLQLDMTFFFMRTTYAWVLSCFSHVRIFVTLWTVGHQAPLTMGVSRQENWSGLPCPPLGGLPDPYESRSPALTAGFFITSTTWEAQIGL